jgi:hypothetical protein
MDPEACWAELVRLAKQCTENLESDEVFADADRMSELVLALDGWLERGGFAPAAWRKNAGNQV